MYVFKFEIVKKNLSVFRGKTRPKCLRSYFAGRMMKPLDRKPVRMAITHINPEGPAQAQGKNGLDGGNTLLLTHPQLHCWWAGHWLDSHPELPIRIPDQPFSSKEALLLMASGTHFLPGSRRNLSLEPGETGNMKKKKGEKQK